MRNTYIRFISLVICVFLIICAFSACKNSNTDTSTSSEYTSSDVQDTIDDVDDLSSETENVFSSEEDFLGEDIFEDDHVEIETSDPTSEQILAYLKHKNSNWVI